MSNLMHFGPWAARVEYDEDISSFHGVVINTRDTITFYGDSIAALREEFANSVNAHVAFCEKHGVRHVH